MEVSAAGFPVRHHPLNGVFLRGSNESALTQTSFSLSVLGFRFVVLTAVGTVYFTRTGQPETLFRTAMCFLFRHIFILRNFFSDFIYELCPLAKACPSFFFTLREKGSSKCFFLPSWAVYPSPLFRRAYQKTASLRRYPSPRAPSVCHAYG